MGKRLFLLSFAGIMGLVNASGILTTADTIQLTGISDAGVVETVEPEPEPVVETIPEAAYTPVVAPQATYTVTSYSSGVMVNPAGIIKTGNLIYGHNSGNIMGSLASRYIGETITINEGGVIQGYQITGMITYEKTSDGEYDYLNGDPFIMNDLIDGAMGHSVALMTCAGQMLPDNDATHRLVVFADRI